MDKKKKLQTDRPTGRQTDSDSYIYPPPQIPTPPPNKTKFVYGWYNDFTKLELYDLQITKAIKKFHELLVMRKSNTSADCKSNLVKQ